MSKLPEELQKLYAFFSALRDERGGQYGPFDSHMKATIHVWQALLDHYVTCNPGTSLAGWLTPLMIAADKIVRAASGSGHADNAIDGSHYLCKAIIMQIEAIMQKEAKE